MALNRYRLEDRANKNNRRAVMLRQMLKRPDRLLGTILLGNNLVNNATVAITTILALRLYGDAGVAASTAIITIVILIFAEVPPKTLAASHPDRIAYFATYILNFLQKVLFPFVLFVSYSAKIFDLIPFFQTKTKADSLEVDELRVAVQASESHIASYQQNMLLSVLELGNTTVDSVMVPRAHIHAIDLEDDMSEIIDQIQTCPHQSVPVYEGSIDNIVGELSLRRFLQSKIESSEFSFELTVDEIKNELREPIYVTDESRLLEQIKRLQVANRSMGIVVDEYGGIKGIVTLKEMLEEIAGVVGGQLPGTTPGIKKEQDGSYLVDAKITVRDLNRMLDWDLHTDGPNTLNGLILEQFEEIPHKGISLTIDGHEIETVRVSGTAVEVVRITPPVRRPQDPEE